MPMPAPRRAIVGDFSGATDEEISNEPEWGSGHNHRVGLRNKDNRIAGFTHDGDHREDDEEFSEQAEKKIRNLIKQAKRGKLINFQDVMNAQTDFRSRRSEEYPPSWRFVVRAEEDKIKNEQEWPANIKKREKEKQKQQEQKKDQSGDQYNHQQHNDEGQDDDSRGHSGEKGNGDSTANGDRNQSSDKQQKVSSHSKDDQKQNDKTNSTREDHSDQRAGSGQVSDSKQQNQSDKDKTTQQSDGTKQADRKLQSSKKKATTKTNEDSDHERDDDEHMWRRSEGHGSKHHDAYKGSNEEEEQNGNSEGQTEYQKLRQKYSPQEITLLRHLQHEKDMMSNLKQNDGLQKSPITSSATNGPMPIDVVDATTPDNWIPRSGNLVRRTGQHPLNGEPRLNALFNAGLITPNELHYVRNHGSVPRLYWDTHEIDVCDGKLKLSMDDLETQFPAINIPVALACDGNRRGELNLLKKSKGFTWGSGVVSCAYWKGALLQDVLKAAGVDQHLSNSRRRWVNFEGCDSPSEGKYATSIPLDYAMDTANDVMLAYEMNNTKLPADHGFPVRLLIPGFVGGRSIKWLGRIWITDHENDSHYHIWDNRVLPTFVTEKDGEFAEAMFRHPSTACYEQNLNSVIVHPSQGEKMNMSDLLKQDTYRVQGYAYDGGGHEVQRVELSLDEGKTWLYCMRNFPDRPVRNGNKFWTWLYWHIDIDTRQLVRVTSLMVRCFNVFKNTQPKKPVWNLMGMMNNGWYIVKTSLDEDGKITFRHPVDQEDEEGWMKPSTENQLTAAKQKGDVPDKQFTRQEIEKHNTKNDCWLVINNTVYDATSVLSWHPGGSATLLANAGKLSTEVTTSFESVHDDYAHKKLQECAIGRVTDKAAQFMQEQAKADAQESAKGGKSDKLLQKKTWTPVKLKSRDKISEDTFKYTFEYGDKKLGLGTCQHIQFGIHMLDKMLIRSYTPTKPIRQNDEDGTFELTVKTYFPDENQPGGAFTNFLYCLPIGEKVEVNGPTGEIEYLGNGKFNIEGQEKAFSKVNLILGGSGITPGYQLIARILETGEDKTQLRIIDANKSEADILLRGELDGFAKEHEDQIKITHVLSHPSDDWKGLKGHVNADIIKDNCFEPADGTATFLCGPPAMIQKAALPALTDWGFKEDENCYGF